jgi:hypothetical protein
MRSHVELVRSSSWTRFAILAALAASTAACSSEVNRFSDNNTFSNPFSNSARSQPAPQPSYAQAPASRVVSQPLPPQNGYQGGYQQGGYQQQGYSQPLPPPPRNYASAPQTQPASSSPRVASTGRAVNVSYGDVTGSVSQAPASGNGWTWEGGTAITVNRGDTLMALSRRQCYVAAGPEAGHPEIYPRGIDFARGRRSTGG